MLAEDSNVQLGDCGGKENVAEGGARSAQVARELEEAFRELVAYVQDAAGSKAFWPFEEELRGRVFHLARLFLTLFLALSSERLEVPARQKVGRKEFRRQPGKSRELKTFFGPVRYWRAYMFQLNGRGGGYYPLDRELGLSRDGFSLGVLGRAVRLATKMSYSAAADLMSAFLGWSPSIKTIERAVLGLGAYTSEWFESAPAPDDEGEVLIIQIDSKATPTVRESELQKRRGKRSAKVPAPSPRHRGRIARGRRGRRERRKPGDKSKNGRMATLVVMYTLKESEADDGSPLLLGPLNRRIYASYAPKRHAVAIAKREAEKRGFGENSGKRVQVITDGDEDLQRYVRELLPHATHTLDVIHVVERLWGVAACLFQRGDSELEEWVENEKTALYTGRVDEVIAEIEGRLRQLPADGRRDTIRSHLNYLRKRTHMMNYGELAAADLELASGVVEGAVRFVIAQRFDEGGMRWIRERAEALLQLRCIDINGDWDDFLAFVDKRLNDQQKRRLRPLRLLRTEPKPLPDYGLA